MRKNWKIIFHIFLTDYEKGFTAAVCELLPEAQLLGCHFFLLLSGFQKSAKFSFSN